MIEFVTTGGMRRNLKLFFPHIRDIQIYTIDPGNVVVKLKAPWWYWIGFGYFHRKLKRNIQTALACQGAAWITYSVDVNGIS